MGLEGVAEMTTNVTQREGGSRKCSLSVTYYLNGPFPLPLPTLAL